MDKNVTSETSHELWGGKEVETFTGRRDKLITYNSKLLKSDGSEICAIKLNRFKEKGIMTIGEEEYELSHRTGSGKWELVQSEKVLCGAVKPKAFQTKLLLNEYDEHGSVKRRLRMQTRRKGLQNCDFYEIATDTNNETAMEGGSMYMSMTSTLLKLDWDVTKLKDDISDVFLAFSFFIFVLLYRRRSQDYSGTLDFYLNDADLFTNLCFIWVIHQEEA